jgi:hypothetical protein
MKVARVREKEAEKDISRVEKGQGGGREVGRWR